MTTAAHSTKTLKQRRLSALSRRAQAAPLILERLKPLLVVPTLSFSSLPEEVDMTYVNEYLLRKGLLILPRVVGNKLALHRPTKKLLVGSFGILEPQSDEPLAVPQLGLIPGLGFDRRGNRIGYGGGYYDRLLPTLDIMTIGVGFEEQLMEGIVPKEHDYQLDQISLF
ncbi:MAG: hypothetical protein S4CHLAM81_03370 [Chlamydiales bacterium]|nr:hypothetical protein [Chlamydiales bacterium]MCH9635127.1 hypothetical protein [Chlamydiales bacterium]MCH9703345.1 5-formyltetrahydrofolate cyclo-ligase [Chlamydiota bacterium]